MRSRWFLFLLYCISIFACAAYLFTTIYHENRTKTFLSQDKTVGVCLEKTGSKECCENPLTVTGSFFLDTHRTWNTETGFKYSQMKYATQLIGVDYTSDDWTQTLTDAKKGLQRIANQSMEDYVDFLPVTFLTWATFSYMKEKQGNFRFSLAGDVGMMWDGIDFVIKNYGNAKNEFGSYNTNLTSIDITYQAVTHTMTVTNTLMLDPQYCYSSYAGQICNADNTIFAFNAMGRIITGPVVDPPSDAINASDDDSTDDDDSTTFVAAQPTNHLALQAKELSFAKSKSIQRDKVDSVHLQYYYPETEVPTELPSEAPTAPTKAPTNVPTKSPTQPPTTSPSLSPTTSPTPLPTITPSISPTTQPSRAPTTAAVNPSSPTSPVTDSPTLSPSNQPSQSPTSTLNPSDSPTYSPSFSPSSQSPVAAPSPTVTPTRFPSYSPSRNPTVAPSRQPTSPPTSDSYYSSTDNPTELPSLSPSSSPTPSPTKSPTQSPNTILSPSYSPSQSPVSVPSLTAPSTHSPTDLPTELPSSYPTSFENYGSTDLPSELPSSYPTTFLNQGDDNNTSVWPTSYPTAFNDTSINDDDTDSPTEPPAQNPSENPDTSSPPPKLQEYKATWSVDMASVSLALSVNMGIIPLHELEKQEVDEIRVNLLDTLYSNGDIDYYTYKNTSSFFSKSYLFTS
jgi:hypothetical protein